MGLSQKGWKALEVGSREGVHAEDLWQVGVQERLEPGDRGFELKLQVQLHSAGGGYP